MGNRYTLVLKTSSVFSTRTSRVQKPAIYFRYVDDTFVIIEQESDVDDFLVTLNRLHPALKFTFEGEHDGKLLFQDVLVEKTELVFNTSVYRLPTFSGQFIRWESFSPRKRKNEPNRPAGTQSIYDIYEKQV